MFPIRKGWDYGEGLASFWLPYFRCTSTLYKSPLNVDETLFIRYIPLLNVILGMCYHPNIDSAAGRAAYTVWLFTWSDLKTIVIPKSCFGVIGGLSGLTIPTSGSSYGIIRRTPLVVVWVWVVLLPFNIDNQRRPDAIEEDKINRPWRPLPSKRISPDQAFWLMLVCHSAAIGYSSLVGGLRQCLGMIALGWLYNGLGGADRSCIAKNAINALGYVDFSMGAVSVATQSDFTPCGLHWFAMVAAVVFSTVQMQDLPDMEGDAVRGRRTVPLVIGARSCRWTIAILVPFWTVIASFFWGFPSGPSLICASFGVVISWRVLSKPKTLDDVLTFRIWNAWLVSLYALPLARSRYKLS